MWRFSPPVIKKQTAWACYPFYYDSYLVTILTILLPYRHRGGTKTSFIDSLFQQSSLSTYWHVPGTDVGAGDATVKWTTLLFSRSLFSSERYRKIYVKNNIICNHYEITKSNTSGCRWGVCDQMHFSSNFTDKELAIWRVSQATEAIMCKALWRMSMNVLWDSGSESNSRITYAIIKMKYSSSLQPFQRILSTSVDHLLFWVFHISGTSIWDLFCGTPVRSVYSLPLKARSSWQE